MIPWKITLFLITGGIKKPQSLNRWLISVHNHLMCCKVITVRLDSLKMVSVDTKTHRRGDYRRLGIHSAMHKTWLVNDDTGKSYSYSSSTTPSVHKISQLFFKWNTLKKWTKVEVVYQNKIHWKQNGVSHTLHKITQKWVKGLRSEKVYCTDLTQHRIHRFY